MTFNFMGLVRCLRGIFQKTIDRGSNQLFYFLGQFISILMQIFENLDLFHTFSNFHLSIITEGKTFKFFKKGVL